MKSPSLKKADVADTRRSCINHVMYLEVVVVGGGSFDELFLSKDKRNLRSRQGRLTSCSFSLAGRSLKPSVVKEAVRFFFYNGFDFE